MSELPKKINTRQLLSYAKDHGYDSVKFMGSSSKAVFVGKFLDAYYEFIQIPVLGSGFLRLSDLEKRIGYDIVFDVLDEEQYRNMVKLDCILRGKEPTKEDT